MRILKNRHVDRLARRHAVSDAALRSAVERAERGLIDAQLGKFLIKQRVSRAKAGKSGGFRTIAFFRAGDLAVLLYLFAKNERENLTAAELDIYREAARTIGAMSRSDVDRVIADGKWSAISKR